MKNKPFLIVIAMIMVAVISVSATLFVVTLQENRKNDMYIRLNEDVSPSLIYLFNEVRQTLKREFISEVDDNVLIEGAIAGLAMSLGDPYTMFVPKDRMDFMRERSDGRYTGIGVTISIPREGIGVLVLLVNKEGPAKQAGMLPGDRIITVDGVDMSNEDNLEFVAGMVRGPDGTEVEVQVYRESENRNITFRMRRALINMINVTGNMETDTVGYIRIYSFTQDAPVEFINTFNDLIQEGMQALVLDIRDNPGGSINAIVSIADHFLNDGLITYVVNRDGVITQYRAKSGAVQLPVVVLINGNSASASEMLAGALKDSGRGFILGTTSFGKGSVQGVFNMSDGSGLRVTVARYYTPAGVSIDQEGIEPDETVAPLEEFLTVPIALIPREQDVQLKRALEILLTSLPN